MKTIKASEPCEPRVNLESEVTLPGPSARGIAARVTQAIHILHIGKTGGTALKAAVAPFAQQAGLVLHDHRTRVRDCPLDDRVFVVVRHPLDRFLSGFNSRLRKGRPRYNYPWSMGEALAFAMFPNPNALAEALSSRNPPRRVAARLAMRSIRHVRSPLSYWLGSAKKVAERPNMIIGTLDTIEADLQRLLAEAGIGARVSLPRDPVMAHAAPVAADRRLSPAAECNLARWYADDIGLYEECCRLRAAAIADSNVAKTGV